MTDAIKPNDEDQARPVQPEVMAVRLRALMEGLEVENIEMAMHSPPSLLRELGQLVARQAKFSSGVLSYLHREP